MFQSTKQLILSGVGSAYPCAAYAVGCGDKVYLRDYAGMRQCNPHKLPLTEDTLFDIASISKVVSATMITLKLIENSVISRDDKIGKYLETYGNYENCSIYHLLTHTSGIAPHMPLYKLCKKEEILDTILNEPPLSHVGEEVNYSCLGYIVLGCILENITGKRLDELANEYVFSPLGMSTACYAPNINRPHSPVATTEFIKDMGIWVSGFVHDENACYLDGVAGNSGVFATLSDMINFVIMCSLKGRTKDGTVYLSEHIFRDAIQNKTPDKAQSRGYGFQLKGWQPSPLADAMSYGSYGHTGFTGTSFYIDAESGLWGIFLTNSVHYGRDERAEYYKIRRNFYKTIQSEFEMLLREGKI